MVLLLTPLFVVGVMGMRPAIERATARELLRESLPLAAAVAMNVIYLRLLVILVSVQTDEVETGLFATSFRIFEILLGIPTLVLAVALPLLAVAGAEDRRRLRYALQQMTEAAVAVSLLLVLVTVVLAEPAILLLGGEQYRDAAPILQVQAFALLGIFLGQVWTLGTDLGPATARCRRRECDRAGARRRTRRRPRPDVRGDRGCACRGRRERGGARGARLLVPRPGRSRCPSGAGLRAIGRSIAGAAGALVALLPLSPWVVAPLAAAVFIVVAFAVRAVPPEIVLALRGRDPR